MDQMREWMVERFGKIGGKCDSPMETLFWAAWQLMKPRLSLTSDAHLNEKLQAPIGKYRADFLFSVLDENKVRVSLVVEIDGHDFHERTKEQAAHDKARDRYMTGEKYQVMRFTGSEVYANPFKCVKEVSDRLYQLQYGETPGRARAKAGFEAIRKILEG
jgi:very-short-patch-repair endonuclease